MQQNHSSYSNIHPSSSPWTLIRTYRKSAVAAAPPRHDRASSHVQTKAGPWLRTRCPDSAKQRWEEAGFSPRHLRAAGARIRAEQQPAAEHTTEEKHDYISPSYGTHSVLYEGEVRLLYKKNKTWCNEVVLNKFEQVSQFTFQMLV